MIESNCRVADKLLYLKFVGYEATYLISVTKETVSVPTPPKWPLNFSESGRHLGRVISGSEVSSQWSWNI